MNYNETKFWLKGYLKSLEGRNDISKQDLENLIKKIRGVIDNIEKKSTLSEDSELNDEDDLPF